MTPQPGNTTTVLTPPATSAIDLRAAIEGYGPAIDLECPHCGGQFTRGRGDIRRTLDRGGMPFCSRTCHLRAMNTPERQAAVAQAGRVKNRAAQLDRGEGKSYRKCHGRHEHRVVAEQMLGRPLAPGEVVHHINEDKRDNRPENLRVFASQAEHARHHLALRRAS